MSNLQLKTTNTTLKDKQKQAVTSLVPQFPLIKTGGETIITSEITMLESLKVLWSICWRVLIFNFLFSSCLSAVVGICWSYFGINLGALAQVLPATPTTTTSYLSTVSPRDLTALMCFTLNWVILIVAANLVIVPYIWRGVLNIKFRNFALRAIRHGSENETITPSWSQLLGMGWSYTWRVLAWRSGMIALLSFLAYFLTSVISIISIHYLEICIPAFYFFTLVLTGTSAIKKLLKISHSGFDLRVVRNKPLINP